MLIPDVSKSWRNSLGIEFWNIFFQFSKLRGWRSYAWVVIKCYKMVIKCYNGGIYLNLLKPTQFQPTLFQFLVSFSFKTIFAPHCAITTLVLKHVKFSCVFLVCIKMMPTHSNAHPKVQNWILKTRFPGNKFEFGIVWSDFWSSTILAI